MSRAMTKIGVSSARVLLYLLLLIDSTSPIILAVTITEYTMLSITL